MLVRVEGAIVKICIDSVNWTVNALRLMWYIFIVVDTRAWFCIVCPCPTPALDCANTARVRVTAGEPWVRVGTRVGFQITS